MPQLFNYLLLFISVLSVIKCQDLESSYDFIIVGGGTAGCALARRLTDDENFHVLLLESGGLPKEGMDIPAFAPQFASNTEVTFRYPSLPQRYASRRNNGSITYIGGRVLGGTSSLNYMYWSRGNPHDWEKWATITHDDSWRYDNMLKYFKKVERYTGEFPTDQHGYEGPITVSRPKYAPGLDYWLKAGIELGYPVADPNGPQKRSFTPVEFSKRNGQRVSSYVGYLQPVLFSRPNLHIILNANVTQILFQDITAMGVRFHTLSQNPPGVSEKVVYAKKEIIISAGVIGSPLLLQRSGLGPKSLLETAKIPVIRDLPVGANFQDHVSLPIHLYINNASVVFNETKDLNQKNLEILRIHGDGPFSSTRGGTGQAFTVSSIAYLEKEREWPDLQLCMSHSVQPYLSAYITSNSLQNSASSSASSSEVPMSAAIFLVRPKSRGSVYLNPEDIYGLPILDMGYFSDPRDMQSLLDGVKETVRIFEQTPSYKKLAARIVDVDFPACRNRVFKSDQYWKCYIRHASQAGLHAGGTCRMGSGINDPEAVVDTKLRVIGVAGLRVVDASIMPAQTNANTQAAVYGIAEKAADMILNYWHGLDAL